MQQLWQVERFCHSSPSLGSTCYVLATSTPAEPTHSNIWSVCVSHAAAAWLRVMHVLICEHGIKLVACMLKDGMMCPQSRSKLKSAQHAVQHPHQTHAAVHDCITAAGDHLIVFASNQQLVHCLALLQHRKAIT